MKEPHAPPVLVPAVLAVLAFLIVFSVGSAIWAIFIRPDIAIDGQIARSGRDEAATVIYCGDGYGACTLDYVVGSTDYQYQASDTCDCSVGSTVTIRYDPSNPRNSYVPGIPRPSNSFPWLLGAFASLGAAWIAWGGSRQIARWLMGG